MLVLREKLIEKEKRILELTRKLKSRDEELKRTRAERDRLAEVSNELRAEL